MSDKRRYAPWMALALLAIIAAAGGLAAPKAALSGPFRVKWVADGDTVLLTDGRWVRYIGIDTPELEKERRPAQSGAVAARRRNRELIGDRPVRLELDRTREDRYGRRLAYVTNHQGRLINEVLVAEGLAHCLPIAPNERFADRLLAAQRQAMAAGIGLWGGLAADLGPVIGNLASKRFHHPDCPDAKKISRRHRHVFENLRSAFHAGYAPAKTCLPAAMVFPHH